MVGMCCGCLQRSRCSDTVILLCYAMLNSTKQHLFGIQLDRTLVRRMAAMSGNILVDPGSDDEEELYNNIYVSPSMVNAEGRAEHLNPYVSLSRNLRRTHTPPTFDDYDDAADEPGNTFDLHSAAHSLYQAHAEQVIEDTGSSASPARSPGR